VKRVFSLLTMFLILLTGCQSAAIPITPTATTIPSPTSAPFNPVVSLSGTPQVVFDWATQRCGDDEHPDLPVRAFRDADGMIQMSISSPTNYRLIGPDFDSLEPDCTPTLISANDRDPSHYNTWDWMGATYTLDGKTIYAIIHNEYHGDQAGSIWQADGDFSTTQGTHDWHYQSWNGSSYADMTYDEAQDRWQGGRPLCQIADRWMHPDLGCEPTRTWVSPINGTVTVSGQVYDLDPKGGNGVVASIYRGSEQIWSATIDNGDTTGQSYDLKVGVQQGDQLHFQVNARGDNGYDTTFFNPGINPGPAPCPSGDHSLCTLISLTYAVSTDGGKSYSQPPDPQHILANLPYQYNPDAMRAIWQPSNIVKNPHDGYYYALIQRDEHGPAVGGDLQGTCAIRTQTLDDPRSWRAWDGSGFNMSFIDPYTDTNADPAAHTCQTVSSNAIGALTYGLSYSTYFDKFIAVGVSGWPTPGFYYSLSDDLVHWTPKQLLMEAQQSFTNGGRTPYYAYPTLIDPASTSHNFDTVGQSPYLYYSRFNQTDPLNIDLLRVRLEFSK
jgi:hypothetical protein